MGVARSTRRRPGALVISLDLELAWGIRDHTEPQRARRRLEGVWRAVPAMLGRFERAQIAATWATVGLLMAPDADAALRAAPTRRPAYADPSLDPYEHLRTVAGSGTQTRLHFAPELVDRIAATARQEIATHTFSHFYACEEGAHPAALKADLQAAIALARSRGHRVRSIVFPRNQWTNEAVAMLEGLGIESYRPNPAHWAFTPGKKRDEGWLRRVYRGADAYLGVRREVTYPWPSETATGVIAVPASRFVRPFSRRLAPGDPLRLARIEVEMARAARRGHLYHLWWHPHNFGEDLDENLAILDAILEAYERHRDRDGMRSLSMADVVDTLRADSPHTVSASR